MEKKKILLIDDEEKFAELLKMNLEGTGKYEVRIENRGSRGAAAAGEFKPNMIFLDILMPDMEGSEVAVQIRGCEDTKDIPIVFLTAVARKNEVKKGGGVIGGHFFIAKPVSTDELVNVIEENTAE